MARTNLPVTSFAKNGAATEVAGTAVDTANGHNCIPSKRTSRLVIVVNNTDAAPHNVTIKAGANPPSLSAGQGDLVIACAATSRTNIGPFESARFAQKDGSLNIDEAAGLTGTLWAYETPRV